MYIPRFYQNLEKYLTTQKALIIYGARQTGKTTMIKHFLKEIPWKYKFVSGEDISVQTILSSQDFKKIKDFCAGYELLVIDEAQDIPNVGLALKIMVDNIPNLRIIATGSSSFDLANKIGEPLVGRQKVLNLFSISQMEILNFNKNKFEIAQENPDYLIFGAYPEILTTATQIEKQEKLLEMVNSYLLKDVLSLENIKKPQTLIRLLKLLAFQVGSEVSLNELAQKLGHDVKTIDRYLDILEKSFVIKSLSGFSKNLRKEVYQKNKYYFFDLGIRNAIINNFNDLETRNDVGALWENFLFMERIKKNEYTKNLCNSYFWRTYDQKEIDYIEEKSGQLFAYEFKYSQRKTKVPKLFLKTYPNSDFQEISQENYLDFIT